MSIEMDKFGNVREYDIDTGQQVNEQRGEGIFDVFKSVGKNVASKVTSKVTKDTAEKAVKNLAQKALDKGTEQIGDEVGEKVGEFVSSKIDNAFIKKAPVSEITKENKGETIMKLLKLHPANKSKPTKERKPVDIISSQFDELLRNPQRNQNPLT